MHVAWSRINAETMTARPLPFFKERLKEAARELEKKLDLTRVKNQRDGHARAPTLNEFEQAKRLGIDLAEVRTAIRDCWDRCDNGRSFEAALAEQGLILAQGDRRAFVVIDRQGGIHALGRRILDVNKTQMLARSADLDLNELPHVDQARAFIRELVPEQRPEKKQPNWNRDRANEGWEDAVITASIEQEELETRFVDPKTQNEIEVGGREKKGRVWEETDTTTMDRFKDAGLETAGSTEPGKPLKGIEKQLWDAYRSGPQANDFAASLDSRGIAFACVTPDETYKSYREAQFAKAVGRIAPVYQEGEIVVVRSPSPEYLRQGEWSELPRVQKLDQAHAEKYLEILGFDKSKLKGIEATKATLETSAQDYAANWQDIRLEHVTRINPNDPVQSARETTATLRTTGSQATGATFNLSEKRQEELCSILDPPTIPLEPQQTAEKACHYREAEAEHSIDFSKYAAYRAQERLNQDELQSARDPLLRGGQFELEREPMETGRPRPFLQEEPPSGTDRKIHKTHQPVNGAIVLEQPANADRAPRSFAGSIKQFFREVKQALTGKEPPAPEPKKRTRRGTEETSSGFRLAARILCRIVQSIFHPSNFLWEPPAELDDAHRQQLQWNSQATFHETDGFHTPSSTSSNDLFPSP
jgi:hypothetical protein